MGHGRRRWLISLLILIPFLALAAQGVPVYVDTGTPSGSCTGSRVRIRHTAGTRYCCNAGTWGVCGDAGDITSGTLPITRGGTAQSNWATDEVMLGTGSGTVERKTIPSCNAASEKLAYNATTHAFTCETDNTTEAFTTGAWVYPTLTSGWSNVGSPYTNTRYRKDPLGVVWVDVAANYTSGGSNVFTLPAGYRPDANVLYAGVANALQALQINSSGSVDVTYGGSGNPHVFMVSFPAGNPIVVSLSPTSISETYYSGGGTQTTASVTCSATGGSGSYSSYAWAYVSGYTATINSPSSATTTFTRSGPSCGYITRAGVFKCTVTDSLGATGTKNITVTQIWDLADC